MEVSPPIPCTGPGLRPLRKAPARRLTEEEFLAWCDSQSSAEWVDGRVITLPPVTFAEDQARGFFLCLLGEFADHAGGSVHGRPFQIRLNPRTRRTADLFFVTAPRCRSLLREFECDGPPDLIIEILGPDCSFAEWREKFTEYEQARVLEYWIFDPLSGRFSAFENVQGNFAPIQWRRTRLHSVALRGFFIDWRWFCGTRYAKISDCCREMGIA